MTDQPAPAPRHVVGTDVAEVAGILARAFATDPVFSWVYGDGEPGRRVGDLAELFAVMVEHTRRRGHVYAVPGAASVWAPPDVALFSQAAGAAFGELFDRQLDAAQQARFGELTAVMGAHHPAEPHFYLMVLGTDPAAQGRGLGSALLADVLRRCDAQGVPAYLEATSPRSRALYERHGYQVTAELRPAGGPPLWSMWREPDTSRQR